jgi:hypothetical protein
VIPLWITSLSEKFRKLQGGTKDVFAAHELLHAIGRDTSSRNLGNVRKEEMKKTLVKSSFATALALLVVVGVLATSASAQSAHARQERIVGVWDVKVNVLNCNNGVQLSTFPGLHKYELGGTGQVVPATNPMALSPHVSVWKYIDDNDYTMTFKMFRFDAFGNNIGWVVVKNKVSINDDATEYTGSGRAEFFDVNGNMVAASCPTFAGKRLE